MRQRVTVVVLCVRVCLCVCVTTLLVMSFNDSNNLRRVCSRFYKRDCRWKASFASYGIFTYCHVHRYTITAIFCWNLGWQSLPHLWKSLGMGEAMPGTPVNVRRRATPLSREAMPGTPVNVRRWARPLCQEMSQASLSWSDARNTSQCQETN